MKDLLLDPETHDLRLVNFDLAFADGIDQVAQNLGIRLRFILGEWFLDITAGVPYYESFFVKSPNRINIESILKNEILNTTGVGEILQFSSDFDNISRNFKVNFKALSDFGPITIEQAFP